jgi:hypothetical protein
MSYFVTDVIINSYTRLYLLLVYASMLSTRKLLLSPLINI